MRDAKRPGDAKCAGPRQAVATEPSAQTHTAPEAAHPPGYVEGTAALHRPEAAAPAPRRNDLPELRSSIRSRVTFRVARLHARLNAQAQVMLESVGVGLLEYRILAIINGMEEPSASDLSRVSDLDKGQLSRKLAQMTAEGIVAARDHPRDRRQHLLVLTDLGRELYSRAMPLMMERDEYFRKLVGDQDLEALHRAFDKLDRAAEKRQF